MEIVTGRTGTPHVTSADDRALIAGIVGRGSYVLDTGSRLAYETPSTTEIVIKDGDITHQGCHARIRFGETERVTLDGGTSGYKRCDLIVARYTLDKSKNTEKVELVVIKGTPAENMPVTPSYISGNIMENAEVSDMPLYKVVLDGVNIESIIPVYSLVPVTLHNVLDIVYPVGAIYMSVNATDPSVLFGGKWQRWGQGRFPISIYEEDKNNFNKPNQTGGSWTHNHIVEVKEHTLTVDEIPAHSHFIGKFVRDITSGILKTDAATGDSFRGVSEIEYASEHNSSETGGGQGHTHEVEIGEAIALPPYIACYMWKRVS